MKRLFLALFLALSIAAPVQAQFNASGQTTADAYAQIRRQAATTRGFLVAQRALMVAPQVNSLVPLGVITHLAGVITRLDALASTPGLPQYAKDQQANQAYDVAAQYTNMRQQMLAVRDNLIAMFPNNGGTPPYLIYETLSATGVKTTRVFTAAQVAPAVAAIDVLIASIQ
jgi:tryptophan 2,3-dioxygenase